MNGGKIVVDADELLKLVDKVRGSVAELSSFLARGMTPAPPSPARQRKAEKASTSAMPVSVNVSGISWLKRDKEPARTDATWSWAYGYDIEGNIRPETQALIQEIQKYGKVTVGGFEFSLGGRDMNLLNRKKV